MVAIVSRWFVVLAGVWLVGLGVFMAVKPRRSLAVLAAMGGSSRIHFGEMAVRALVGLTLIGAASVSRFPPVLTIFGAFLIVSALVIAMLPRRWHSTYSRWWAGRIPVWAVPCAGLLSVVGGVVLVLVVL